MDEFNYDNDDVELDDNGLPVKKDSADASNNNNQSSSGDFDYYNDTGDFDYYNNSSDFDYYNDTSGFDYANQDNQGDEDEDEDVDSEDESTEESQNSKSGGNWFSRLTGGNKGTSFFGGLGSKNSKSSSSAKKQLIKKWLPKLLPVVGWVLLAAVVIVLIFSIISSVAAIFQEKTNPDNMKENAYITSEYFYGVRNVYVDDDALLNSLQLSYKQLSIDVLNKIDLNIDVKVNISLPSTPIDNLTNVDEKIVDMSIAIGNIVATGSSEYNVDFGTLYPNIDHFGLTAEESELVGDFLVSYFDSQSIISITGTLTTEQLVDNALSSDELKYMYNVCEKVMIKDELANENGLSNIEQRKYLASIYMPNRDITINGSSYAIVNQNEDYSTNIKLIEHNNGSIITHLDTTTESDTEIIDGLSSNPVTIKQFTSINSSNIQDYSSGISLFDAIKSHPTAINHFSKDSDTGIYTWIPKDSSLLYLTFNTSGQFIFTEFAIDIQPA